MGYITESGLGVTGTLLPEYESFFKKFSKLLWDVDPYYSKFQSRGKSFPKIVVDNFLNFNRPAKNMSTLSIASQVNEMKDYLDRKFINMNCMKKLRDIVKTVVENIMDHFDILEKQRTRTLVHSHQETSSNEAHNLNEFITTNLKMRVSTSNSCHASNYKLIHNALLEADVYDTAMLNSILNVGNTHKLRTQHYRFIQDMMQNGLPFVIPGVLIFHFKLPSQGPHKAVHFLWKQPVLDETNNPQQTKLICGLRNKKGLYYTGSMKREIRLKLSKLGIVKPNQATYIIKDLLGDKSAAENENQREVLQMLQTVVSAGEEIIVDLRKNNGSKPKYDEFWDVVADHISEKTAVDDRRHSASSTEERNVVSNHYHIYHV